MAALLPSSDVPATILLVEDDPLIRELTQAGLESSGYRVLAADSVPAATECWNRNAHSVDLVIADLTLSGRGNGQELVRQLQADGSAFGVIFISGYDAASLPRSHGLDCTNFLQKPFRMERLMGMVRDCLATPHCAKASEARSALRVIQSVNLPETREAIATCQVTDVKSIPNRDTGVSQPLRLVGVDDSNDEPVVVVIAEDDAVSRKLVNVVVENAGYQTIVTKDGDEAMSALRERERPCVAVIDWMMPGVDGAEICRRTRKGGKSVYIIMLTARGGKEDVVEAMDAGADDYMVKPFDREELLARIRTGIKQLDSNNALQAQITELETAIVETNITKFQQASRTYAPAVLVMDDDSAMHALLEIYLTSFGYRVLAARTTDEGKRMLSARSDVRVLIVDYEKGQELAQHANAAQPSVQILFCSQRSPADAATPLIGEFLKKPYLPAELKRRMEILLAKSVRGVRVDCVQPPFTLLSVEPANREAHAQLLYSL